MSDKPAALITVRASSGRLPNKCFLPLGGIPVLEHVIRRAEKGGFLPFVCTSVEVSDDPIEDLAKELEVDFFRGDLENKLNRWKNCMREFELSAVHLVDADDPYFDPMEMHKSYDLLHRDKLDLVLTSLRSDAGFASVGTSITFDFSQELVERATHLKSANFDVIPWDLLLQPQDHVATMPNMNLGIPADVQLRLTLDYPEDHELLAALGEEFPFDVPRLDLEMYLLSNPDLRQINLFRSADFLQNKRDFRNAQFH